MMRTTATGIAATSSNDIAAANYDISASTSYDTREADDCSKYDNMLMTIANMAIRRRRMRRGHYR